MLGIKEKRNERVGTSISHGVIVLSVAGVMNPISQAAPVSFRSCGMQIHGPCMWKLFEPTDTLKHTLGQTFILSQAVLNFFGLMLCKK